MAWVGLGQGVAALGGLVGVRALTGVLTPHVYGEVALALSVASLGQLVAWSPITGAVLRYFSPALESRRLRAYLQAVRLLVLQTTAATIAAGAVLLLGMWALGVTRWIGLVVATVLFALVSGYEHTLDGMQLAGRQRRVVAWHQGLAIWLRFLIAVFFVSLFGPRSVVAMIGFAVALSMVLCSQLLFFKRKVLRLRALQPPVAETDAASLTRRMHAYAWPIAAFGAFGWIQAVSDRWILQEFTTTSEVGLYMVVYQLGFYPMTLMSAVTLQFTSPLLFERSGESSDPERLERAWSLVVGILMITFVLTVVATTFTAVVHERIFRVFAGTGYRYVSHLLPWMVLAGGLFACGQAASQAVLVSTRTSRLIMPKGIVAVVGLGLYALGASAGGLDGVIYANVGSSAMYFAWMYALARGWRNSLSGTAPSEALLPVSREDLL